MSESTYRPERICTEKEVEAILAEASRGNAAARHPEDHVNAVKRRTILEVLFGTGIRSHELVNLKPANVEWPSEQNEFRCYLNLAVTKGGRQRSVPVPPRVVEWLQRWAEVSSVWRMSNACTADYLFHQCDKRVFGKHIGKPVSTRSLRYMVENAVRRALGEEALDRISPHTCRHRYITKLLIEKQVPLMTVTKLVGHVKPETTARYTHPTKADLYAAVADL